MKKLIKYQKGSKFKYLPEDSKQDNTKVNKVIIPQTVLRNSATGQMLTGASDKTLVDKERTAATYKNIDAISAPKDLSLREKILRQTYRFNDKVTGGNLISDFVAAPARLLRPDKYFDGVRNDSDVGSALLGLGGDALMTLPLLGTPGKISKYLKEIPDEVNRLKVESHYSLDDIMAMTDNQIETLSRQNPNVRKMLENDWDPRNRIEIGIDKMHNSKTYSKLADHLNTGTSLEARQKLVDAINIKESPITEQNIEAFRNNKYQKMMRGNNMLISKNNLETNINPNQVEPMLDQFKTSFGDSRLSNTVKKFFHSKYNNYVPDDMHLYNDFTNGNDQIFHANLNPINKRIENYLFVGKSEYNPKTLLNEITRNSKLQAGKFSNDLIKHGPYNYTYDPGSLSGDSYTLYNRAIQKNSNMLQPAEGFGEKSYFNGMGENSELSKDLRTLNSDYLKTSADRVLNQVRNITDKTYEKLGVDSHRPLINEPGTYYHTPVKKVMVKDFKPLEVNQTINTRPLNNYNPDRVEHIDNIRRTLNDSQLRTFNNHLNGYTDSFGQVHLTNAELQNILPSILDNTLPPPPTEIHGVY